MKIHISQSMANIEPNESNVDCYLYISAQPDTKHKVPRIKASLTPIVRGKSRNTIEVSISDYPIQLSPKNRVVLSANVFKQVSMWIVLNKTVLLQYWNSEVVSTKQVLNSLKSL